MADQNITALPVATSPASSDQLLLVGATEEKLIDYDKLADAILTKLTSKQYTLDQGTKTLPAALNELNSNLLKTQIIDTRSTNKPPQYYYSNYPQTVVYELKESISVDDPFQAAAFLVLQTITPWNDTSGGSVIQRAYMSGKVKIRYSKSIDSWSEWTN